MPTETAGPPDNVDVYRDRNAFYESLTRQAQDVFLAILAEAEEEGLGQEEAWQAAANAVQEAYPPTGRDAAR